MHYVAVTSAELMATTWAYLHPVDGRLQLSPTPVPIASPADAERALALAEDFYSFGHYPWCASLSGPMGQFSTHYHGQESQACLIEELHGLALERALIAH